MLRRRFLLAPVVAAAGPFVLRGATLSMKERVNRAMTAQDLDRPPFSLWHHFGLKTAEAHAARTLEFHNTYRTDIVKVMSDFPYPAVTSGRWYQLKVESNPYPDQIHALELIRDGIRGTAYIIETVFNAWNVAQKLSSKEEVLRLKQENPQALVDALDAINRSLIEHARKALSSGASGILFSVANANAAELSLPDYERFSRPFDKRFLDAIANAKLNILHLHVEPPYLARFKDFKVPILNYSRVVSGISIADARQEFPTWVIAGGIDEVNYRKLTVQDLQRQWRSAALEAGRTFILTPGCSVPNDCTPEELERLAKAVGA